jgi:aryl-alcohol dehydrogenase-like predicted oxidoreductase
LGEAKRKAKKEMQRWKSGLETESGLSPAGRIEFGYASCGSLSFQFDIPFLLMHLRDLGKTGLRISPLGLGTVKLGRNTGVKYPGAFELPSDGQALDLLRAADRLGINLIDTAPAYGTSEERLGELLPKVAPRDRWVICTKAGETFEGGASTFDFSPEAVTASIERSLKRLKTDRVEIALLHSDGDDERVILRSGALDALRRLKDRGLVRAIGVSTKTPEGAVLAAERAGVVMLTLNRERREDAPAAALAGKRGVGVLVKKALSSGHDADPVAAFRAVFACAGVSGVIVGTINPAHLEANSIAAEAALSGLPRTENQT